MSYIPPQTVTGLMLTGKVKTADTTRSNTITATADPDLSVSVKASTRYLVTADLIFTTAILSGFKTQFGLPAGATSQYVNVGQNDGLVKNLTDLIGIAVTSTNPNYMFLRGIVRTGATPGTIDLRWAQNVIGLGATVLKADSSLTLIELV